LEDWKIERKIPAMRKYKPEIYVMALEDRRPLFRRKDIKLVDFQMQ